MIVYIRQGKPNGSVMAPPSKSFSHRELIAAMLSGHSTVQNLSYSEDVLATLDCATSFGASWEKKDNIVAFIKSNKVNDCPVFDCRESGSTLRFFLPIALSRYERFVLRGTTRLIERGVGAYESCLSLHGISFKKGEDEIEVSGKLRPGTFNIDASKSSQYVTGLLFALPLLDGDSKIRYIGNPSSIPYIDMTLETLRGFGIRIIPSENGFDIPGNQTYSQRATTVEGDYSNAAFLEAFAYLGYQVEVKGLNPDSSQGDKVYRERFSSLKEERATIDLDSSIDLAPVLFTFAALNKGGHFTGTSRLAIKESNRADVMKEELEKALCRVEIKENEVDVYPIEKIPAHLHFSSHNDHRIAMALSLFSAYSDVEIDGAECVNKSFPDYFEVLKKLGLEVSQHE